ncbi:J domain-containing protein [Streptomyces griseosporeus]|uniref:J domain-containing protein n=1 Tax=Streptomyces griseosporeus TaxID=1910 RepID=UPI0036FF4567
MQARDQRPEPDPYAVLGLGSSATAGEITSAFRARVRALRPDTRVDAVTAARFGELKAAYETLRGPLRRAAYDRHHRRIQGSPPPVPRVRSTRPFLLGPEAARPEPPLRAGPVRREPGR